MIKALLAAALFNGIYMTIWFVIGHIKKNNTVVDIAWGTVFMLMTFTTLIITGLYLPRQLLVTVLICTWAIRLSSHLFLRVIKSQEDPRYAAWRKAWGSSILIRSFLQIYLLQGILAFIICLPTLIINTSTASGLTFLDGLGTLLWSIGFFFEVVADAQLKQFLQNPENRGKIMDRGLWHYSRHPNYFGEATMWWGIWIIALSVPYGFWTIISPLVITYFLVFISGVPMTEALFEGNRTYDEYKKRTSAFFPLPPKKV